jgi:molybdopterin converting factor small subunit
MYWSGPADVQVEAASVEDAIREIARKDAGLAARIVDEQGALRPYVHVFVNEEAVAPGALAEARLRAGDVIRVLPSVAGG